MLENYDWCKRTLYPYENNVWKVSVQCWIASWRPLRALATESSGDGDLTRPDLAYRSVVVRRVRLDRESEDRAILGRP